MAGRLSVMDNAFRSAKSQQDGFSSHPRGWGRFFDTCWHGLPDGPGQPWMLDPVGRWPGLKLIEVFNFDHRVLVRTWHLTVPDVWQN
jgi:hypothetical protein